MVTSKIRMTESTDLSDLPTYGYLTSKGTATAAENVTVKLGEAGN